MTCQEIIMKLQLRASEKYKVNVVRMGIPEIYKRRAAFVLIASSVIYDKDISNDTLDDYLQLIYKNSQDGHEHIKKAISWALREIGKKISITTRRHFYWHMNSR